MSEKAINNLRKYINEDVIYKSKKAESDFDKYCINHCKDIETVLNLIQLQQEEIERLRNIKDMKEAIELANMNIKDFVYFKYRNEQLETNNKKLIEKLEKDIKIYSEEGCCRKQVREGIVREAQEILKIAKGEKE